MQSDLADNNAYGYLLSFVHASSKLFLSRSAYKSILQADTIDDIVVKLGATVYSTYLREKRVKDKKGLIRALESGLKEEFNRVYEKSDSGLKLLLEFFLHSHMIESFIYRISNPEDTDEEIGFFLELNTLKFAKSFKEIHNFIIKGSFMEKYFTKIPVEDEIEKNNMQMIKSKLNKHHIEDFYMTLTTGNFLNNESGEIRSESLNYMVTVLKTMGSLQIIEIVLNTIHTDLSPAVRIQLFPNVNDLKPSVRQALADCHSIDDLRAILLKTNHSTVVKHTDILTGIHQQFLNVLYDSFKTFNDLSCVYCYFKLKEQEIRNLGWIVEFLDGDEKDVIENIYTVD